MKIPLHVAFIMDGNGRWAKERGKERTYGHENGVETVRMVIETCGHIGVKYVTLYAFSTENWKRPQEEIDVLMSLFVHSIHAELPTLQKNKIRLAAIGNLQSLPRECYDELQRAITETAHNDSLTLILALSYSARWEITEMIKKIVEKSLSQGISVRNIDEKMVAEHLCTAPYPDPDILIRTGGELRLSNFLLWQLAYGELFFSDKMWPEFSKDDLLAIIEEYQTRERRYGKISEQVISH